MEIEFLAPTLRLALPLLLAAIGELVVERSGIINIGIEGMMLIGAFFAFWGCFVTGSVLFGVASGVFAGMMVALLFALFCVYFPCDQIIVGTGVNLLALGLTGTLFRFAFGFRTTAEVVPAPEAMFEIFFWAIPVLTYIFLRRTYFGLSLHAAGEAPHAVETMGHSVRKIRLCALLFGGAMAGLAGAYLSIVSSATFVEGMTSGRGFIALAIVIFGRWHPLGILAASLFFGWALSLQYQIQALGSKIPYQLIRMLPYVLTLAVLAILGQKRGGAPEALGKPFVK